MLFNGKATYGRNGKTKIDWAEPNKVNKVGVFTL